MPQYHYAKPFDFVRDFKNLQDAVKQLQLRSLGSLAHPVVQSETDVPATPYSSSAATFASITNAYSILGNDANDGTIYRLTAFGDLTTPASALQAHRWAVSVYGNTLATTSIAASGLTASNTYDWFVTATVAVMTSGSAGTIYCWVSGTISNHNINLSGSNSYALTGSSGGTVAVDTTADTTISLASEWAAVETAQIAHSYGSSWERIGQ